MSHAMQVLALLEERPFDPRELAGILATPLAIIEQTLHALRHAGSVKTIGSAKKWTLITTAPGLGGRPPTIPPSRNQEILALLADGPKSSGAIGDEIKLSHSPVIRRLQRMRADGTVKSFGRGRFTQWALPAYVVPATGAAGGTKGAGTRTPAEPAWWTAFAAPGSDRAAFSAEVERRHHARLQQQKPGAGIQHWTNKPKPAAAPDLEPPDIDDTLVVDPDLEEPADA